jgi:hypothetical protein
MAGVCSGGLGFLEVNGTIWTWKRVGAFWRQVVVRSFLLRSPLRAFCNAEREIACAGEVVVAEGHMAGALEVGKVAEMKGDHLLGQGQVRKDTLKNRPEQVGNGDLIVHFH